jgi:predicted short-subunit dehydrogenase-like oxidoreductase (DUF2520 family)
MTVGDITNNVVSQALASAQIEKLKADTVKTGQETENLKVEGTILSADALTRAALNEQALEIGKSTIYVNHSIANLNHKEAELVSNRISEVAANTNLLYQKAEEVKANIRNVIGVPVRTPFTISSKIVRSNSIIYKQLTHLVYQPFTVSAF